MNLSLPVLHLETMENRMLKYEDNDHMTPLETAACQDQVNLIKSKIKNTLGIPDSCCILMNTVCIGNCKKTIVMIECGMSQKMKIYSIDKHPSEIKEEDIEHLEYNHFRPCVNKISLA